MSEWRGILHPRDRSGRFRQSLERLAREQKAEGRVEFDGGAIARDRKGNWLSVPRSDAPTGRHKTPRGAVDRMIGLGLAHPGAEAGFVRVRDRLLRAVPAGTRLSPAESAAVEKIRADDRDARDRTGYSRSGAPTLWIMEDPEGVRWGVRPIGTGGNVYMRLTPEGKSSPGVGRSARDEAILGSAGPRQRARIEDLLRAGGRIGASAEGTTTVHTGRGPVQVYYGGDTHPPLGKASPGIRGPVRGARLGVKDARGNDIRMGDHVRHAGGVGEVFQHDSRFGLGVDGASRGLSPKDVVVERSVLRPAGAAAIQDQYARMDRAAEDRGMERPRLSKTATGGKYEVKLKDGSRKTVKAASSRKALKSVPGSVYAVPALGAASPGAMAAGGLGNVNPSGGGASRLTPEIRLRMLDRNTVYGSGLRPGDPVAAAAQALVELYRAQEVHHPGTEEAAAARREVERTWSGLDPVSRARARRLAVHMHDRGAEVGRPPQTRVA